MAAEDPRGTLMWFGGFKVYKVSGEEIIIPCGSVIMFPNGEVVFNGEFIFHGSLAFKNPQQWIKQIKMLGIPEGENDIF